MLQGRTLEIADAVRSVLSRDLLKPEWRRAADTKACDVTGHCYAATEAAYHLLGGSTDGWVPQLLSHASWPEGLAPGQTHWFLKNRVTGAVVDITSGQFGGRAPRHDAAKGCGFLTRKPSKRAGEVIRRVLSKDGFREGDFAG